MGVFDRFKRKASGTIDINEYDDDDAYDTLNVWDAADIWASNGKDEDYMFGYTEEELEKAFKEGF